MRTAVDLINLSPSVPLSGDIHERVWKGKDVSHKHLRVFGCRAFVHIPRDERFKLDGKSKQCIFLGYGNEEFGYRLWDPVSKKIVRSRYVIFFEDQTIEDIEKEDKPKPIARNDSVYEPELPTRDINDGGDANTNVPPINTELRKSVRQSRPSQKYPPHEYVLLTDGGEPERYEEALEHDHKEKWLITMQEEMQSLQENHTFELVKLPKGKKALKNKWVFIVKGFNQKKGIDYEEIFTLVVKMSSIRVVLGLTASLNLEVEQLDVKTTFLHGDLEEEIYMEQPEGFAAKGEENLICRLKK
ncbi:hypothetical protein L6164_013610 [Bauhinia variegata]|uniref:Uncharacterized protein n=1 Tax=Bauhinia variegata TaxID=167791 RepID=A0ACB9NFX0_BAUVA|nr:hypothetical protein L6164_013610 [Bauhinia variegata]